MNQPTQPLFKMFSAVKNMLRKRNKLQEKELQEDFLKAVFEHRDKMTIEEAKQKAKTLNSAPENIAAVVGALVFNGELTAGECIELTEEGRKHALKIIRAHRIYEQYLAEHSGYAPPEWHERAHRMEHRISDDERERIASLLGNPLFDPHGDPIPTHSLEMIDKAPVGQPLKVQSWWKITHVEDDNLTLFARIADTGITKDSIIFITHIDNVSFAFRYEGERFVLPVVALSAINMEPISETEASKQPETRARRLVNLESGKTVRIVGLSPSCRGALRRRLMDLGFVRGSTVGIDMRSPMGNPIAYTVRGTAIALRHDQAKYILYQEL